MYYVLFKSIGGFRGLKMTICQDLSLLPLLYTKIVSLWMGKPLFLLIFACFDQFNNGLIIFLQPSSLSEVTYNRCVQFILKLITNSKLEYHIHDPHTV